MAGATLLHALFFFLGKHGPGCQGVGKGFYVMGTVVPQVGKDSLAGLHSI
jgi:hypothetical protein